MHYGVSKVEQPLKLLDICHLPPPRVPETQILPLVEDTTNRNLVRCARKRFVDWAFVDLGEAMGAHKLAFTVSRSPTQAMPSRRTALRPLPRERQPHWFGYLLSEQLGEAEEDNDDCGNQETNDEQVYVNLGCLECQSSFRTRFTGLTDYHHEPSKAPKEQRNAADHVLPIPRPCRRHR